MESFIELMDKDRQRKLLYGALKDLLPGMQDFEYAALIEKVMNKIEAVQAFSDELAAKRTDELRQTALDLGVSEDVVLGSFVYFMTILENVLLGEEVGMLKDVIDM